MRIRYVLGLLILVVISLSGCDVNLPERADPPTVAPPMETATRSPTAQAATQPPATDLAPQPPTHNPATLSPVTREPATVEATKPAKPSPTGLVPPTLEIGKLPAATASPTPVPQEPPELTVYENADYGFNFSYPAERWIAIERGDERNGLTLAYHELGIALRMRFKAVGENANLQLYGGAAGDFVSQGTVEFIGQEVERTALVFRGVTTRVFYNNTEAIERGNMLFSFALVYSQDYGRESLPETVQVEADRILESFRLKN